MTKHIGISGFSSIGRLATRAEGELYQDKVEGVAVNELTDANTHADLVEHDTDSRVYPGHLEKGLGVVETTDVVFDADKAAGHFKDRVNKVFTFTPAQGEELTMVLGVNDDPHDSSKPNPSPFYSGTSDYVTPGQMRLEETAHDPLGNPMKGAVPYDPDVKQSIYIPSGENERLYEVSNGQPHVYASSIEVDWRF